MKIAAIRMKWFIRQYKPQSIENQHLLMPAWTTTTLHQNWLLFPWWVICPIISFYTCNLECESRRFYHGLNSANFSKIISLILEHTSLLCKRIAKFLNVYDGCGKTVGNHNFGTGVCCFIRPVHYFVGTHIETCSNSKTHQPNSKATNYCSCWSEWRKCWDGRWC